MDVSLAIALACERVATTETDDADWAGLVADLAKCRFEGDDGPLQLRIALSTRLKPPPPLDEPMENLYVRALEALDFSNAGL